MKNGLIFNIQKFCINDGPGIRTTVFLKGCPLRCQWCHNPESQLLRPELLYDESKCVGCGRCGAACPQKAHSFEQGHQFNRSQCTACGACAEACAFDALEPAGKETEIREILEEVLKDRAFYENSGGGLTLSGGEPLQQPDFTYELLRQAKEQGLHTCIETCGFAKADDILKIAEVTDLFLYDWKLTDDRLHKKYTGAGNGLIRENLLAIDKAGASIILKCPIIPGVNDTQAHFCGIAALANSLQNIKGIEIEPYHPLGNGKFEKLGREAQTFKMPEENEITGWIAEIQKNTKINVKKA